MPSAAAGIDCHGMERGAHTHIYTSSLSRRERARRSGRRRWSRYATPIVAGVIVAAASLSGLLGHLV